MDAEGAEQRMPLAWAAGVRLEDIEVVNLPWLAGYRHQRCFIRAIAQRLMELFAVSGLLMECAEDAGDPLAVLPVLFHLMWRQDLVADLGVLLSDRTVVTAGKHR